MNELTGVAAPFAFGANASMPDGDVSLKTYVVPDAGAGPEVGVAVGVAVGERCGTTPAFPPGPLQLASTAPQHTAPQQKRENKNPGTFNRRLMPPV